MKSDLFTATSIALLRSAVGWQSAIARRLGIESRTVRRWLAAGETPEWVDQKLVELTGADEISPWPRDEWMVGDGLGEDGRRREYIMHLQPPRFVARVVACDDDGRPARSEEPADVTRGVVYTTDNSCLCEIDWIETVAPGEHVKWLEAACDALDAISERA